MGLFGFKSAKEVEEEKRRAVAAAEARAKVEAENKLKAETRKAMAIGNAMGEANAIRKNYDNLENLSRGSQVKFVVLEFDVFDPRFMNIAVPVVVHGTISYAIEDLDLFYNLNKMEKFDDETFQGKLKASVVKYVKSVVSNVPADAQIPVVQLERKILEISSIVQNQVTPQIERVFGVAVRSLDITDIIIDKRSHGYRQLYALTAELEKENTLAQHEVNMSNFMLNNDLQQQQLKTQSSLGVDAMRRQQEMTLGGQEEMQAMQLEHQREMMRIQREEMQRASRLQTEQTFLGAHQTNLYAEMVNNVGTFGNVADYSKQFASPQMPAMGGGMPQMPGITKSAPQPQVQYMVGVNGQQAGPFDWNQLQQLVQQGQLTRQTYVWTQGMANWELAGNVADLGSLFGNSAPQMPGFPPRF